MRTEGRDRDGALVSLELEPTTDRDRADAVAAGLTLAREVLQLRVALPLARHRPSSITVRPFVSDVDDTEFLRVNNRAFEWHPDQSGWTLDHLRSRRTEPWFDADGFLVHESDGRMAGFCWTKIHPATDEDPALGEIYVIGVDPDAQGRGLGRELVLAGLAHLASRGLAVGMLHVESDNLAARRLYDDLGFTVHSSHTWWRRPEDDRS